MYKITLPINLDGVRYGIDFFKGVGETDNEKVAQRMREKGFTVEDSARVDDSPPASTEKESTRPGRPRKVFESEDGGSE